MKGMVAIVLVLVLALAGLLLFQHSSELGEAGAVAQKPLTEVNVVTQLPLVEDKIQPPVIDIAPVDEPLSEVAEVVVNPEEAVTNPDVVEPLNESPKEELVRVLVGHGQASVEQLEADFEKALDGGWAGYEKLLERSLAASIDRLPVGPQADPYAPVWQAELFYQALLRWQVLQVLPPSLWMTTSELSASGDLPRWLFNNQQAMEEVLLTVSEKDDVAQVLPMLVRLWGSHVEEPELGQKYFNLALACAVVFDRQLKYREPSGADGYDVDPEKRYAWYVKQNQRGWLEVSIDRSPARDLVFVVCAPVSEAELDWAVRKFRSMRRGGWGKNYGAVKYLMERAVEGLNPYDAYTLDQILEEGGICGDQTYFCVNTARAAGIPALGLSGVTDAGGHAWAAVKVEPDEWSTTIGRVGGVSNGMGADPQTGEAISEQEIWMWSSREYQSAKRVLTVHRHLWLADLLGRHGHDQEVVAAVGVAFRVGRAFPIVWESMYQVMLKDPELQKDPAAAASIRQWDEFAQSIKLEFKENPRMGALAVRVEDERVFPHQDLNDVRRSLMRDRRRHERNAAEQSDLVVATLKREARFLMDKDPDNAKREICQLYDKALKDYGRSVTGFRTMAEDYFGLVRSDEQLASKAVRDIELAFQRVVDSGSTDFFRAKVEVGIHKRICEMYRQIGDEKRAKLLESRFERQMEKAKRGAL